MYIQLQGSSHTLGLRLRLPADLVIQVLQDGYILRPGVCHIGTVDCPDTSVYQGLFHRLQTVPASGCQLAEGQDKVRFQGQGVIILAVIQVDIHRIHTLITGGRDLNDLTAKPAYQRPILSLRVADNDIVHGSQEHAADAHFGTKGLTAAGSAEDQTVGGL